VTLRSGMDSWIWFPYGIPWSMILTNQPI